MTIQEYLEKAVPQTIITDGVHTVTVDITKNNRDLYEKGLRVGMEFAYRIAELGFYLRKDKYWQRKESGNRVYTTEMLFGYFLDEKFSNDKTETP
jgi:hypothetical protein